MGMVTGTVPIEDAGTRGGREVRGDLVCGLCTRTAARVEGTWGARFVPRKLWVRDAEHGEGVRRMRCPHCGGHLALDNQQEVYIAPAVLTAEREQARAQAAGRPGQPRRQW